MNPEYINFLCNALTGRNPDQYFDEHRGRILDGAKQLRYMCKTPPGRVYRGVIVPDSKVKDLKLKPLDYIRFVSFSASEAVAKTFADTEHAMSFMVKLARPTDKGYMITATYDTRDLLFHYEWAKPIGLDRHVPIQVILEQKEVMLRNGVTYDVTPFLPGTSDPNLNRTLEGHEPKEYELYRNGLIKMSPEEFCDLMFKKYG